MASGSNSSVLIFDTENPIRTPLRYTLTLLGDAMGKGVANELLFKDYVYSSDDTDR